MITLEDKLYTSTEVAEILGVSLRSVYRYLEEDKLTADIKTATGRHRFSKKNILDFLYPDGGASEVTSMPISARPSDYKKPSDKKAEKSKEVIKEEMDEPIPANEEKEEPIDWLAKFREAAKKYREEAEIEKTIEPVKPVMPIKEEPVMEPAEMVGNVEMESSLISKSAERPAGVSAFTDEKPGLRKLYYRSNLGGLKDIAQSIDRGSRSSFLEYAFTLNAGLSLYKPIKPFSVLHVYVRPSDLSFYEKSLGLTPSDETNSQLSLLVSDESQIYSQKDELHGLFVVSKEKLLEDIRSFGDPNINAEAAGILK